MANISNYREILLVVNSSFAQKDFCENQPLEGLSSDSHAEKMIRACWNGLLVDLLPELVSDAEFKQKLYLSDICRLSLCLFIQMDTAPNTKEREFTINPGMIDFPRIYN